MERRQHQKRAEEVLRTQVEANFVVLEDDNTLLGDDDSPGVGKAAMAAALIQTYGTTAFTAVNGKVDLALLVRSRVSAGGVLVQITDSNQDLSTRARRRVVIGTYVPRDNLVEVARDLILKLLNSRRIQLSTDADGATWLILCMDSPDNMTYLRSMVWKKRKKLNDLVRNQAGLQSVNVETPLSEVGFQSSFESVCSNKALLGIVAEQMAFELQNDNLEQAWVRPFSKDHDHHHVELIGLMGGTSDCVVVVSPTGASEMSMGTFGTTTVEAVENALKTTPGQGQVRASVRGNRACFALRKSPRHHQLRVCDDVRARVRVRACVCPGRGDALPRGLVPSATRCIVWGRTAREALHVRLQVKRRRRSHGCRRVLRRTGACSSEYRCWSECGCPRAAPAAPNAPQVKGHVCCVRAPAAPVAGGQRGRATRWVGQWCGTRSAGRRCKIGGGAGERHRAARVHPLWGPRP